MPCTRNALAVLEGRVSVLTPTYNHEQYIGACIESVLGQTYRDWELIIIDDESTDDTPRIVQRYTDPRISYIRQPHAGALQLAATYNVALRHARGQFVGILEGDDLWAPEKLEWLLPAFADPRVVLAYGATGVVADGRVIKQILPDPKVVRLFGPSALLNEPVGSATRVMLDMRGGTFTHPCSVLMRRAALDRVGGFQHVPGLGVTDYPTFLALTLEGAFSRDERVVAYWRRHATSTSWLMHERIAEGAHAYSRLFREARGTEVAQLTRSAITEIEQSWRDLHAKLALRRGRRLLFGKHWSAARKAFADATKTPNARTATAAAIGVAASWLHQDIEWMYRLAGHADLSSMGFRPESSLIPDDRDSSS